MQRLGSDQPCEANVRPPDASRTGDEHNLIPCTVLTCIKDIGSMNDNIHMTHFCKHAQHISEDSPNLNWPKAIECNACENAFLAASRMSGVCLVLKVYR